MQIDQAKFAKLFPGANPSLLPHLIAAMERYSIDTLLRECAFLAQIGHESNGLTVFVENLNYSAQRLCAVWPKRFPTLAIAEPYHRNPEKIANKVYANRMGNGSPETGDGWRYRGRGAKQITGKTNYQLYGDAVGIDAVGNPDLLSQPEHACLSAAWYWNSCNLNALADKEDIRQMTKLINGGYNGLEDRTSRYKRAKQVYGI